MKIISVELNGYKFSSPLDSLSSDLLILGDEKLNTIISEQIVNDTVKVSIENAEFSGTIERITIMIMELDNCRIVNAESGEIAAKIKKKKFKQKNYSRHYSGGFKYIDKSLGNIILKHVIWVN